ncbi:chitin deacetylase [Modicella reniformis]|uniref:Chitin deacetylase n=1 Tax=Modicella reniformis TaxID=1440133 RepID=A0A9P6J4L6_9FUNG|nr:chitin deacetylase [Modicella reniformis]
MRFSGSTILSVLALPLLVTAGEGVTWADFLTSCQTPGQISLTYSEGPSKATIEMLQTLKEAQAKVTFFANATWLQYMQYAGVTRHAYLDGHLIGMTYRLPSDSSAGLTEDEVKNDIARNSRTIQDLIGVYPKYMKIHESNLKDPQLLNIAKSMGYTLASYVVAGYDVPSTGAAAALPKVINTINTHGYDMVRLDGCTNDKTPYKKDPIQNNGNVGDDKSFGAAEYKHGQSNVKTVDFTPSNNNKDGSVPVGGGSAGNDGAKNSNDGEMKKSGASRSSVVATSALAVLSAVAYSLFF